MIGYAALPARITAIDRDPVAVERLRDGIAAFGAEDKFDIVTADFCDTNITADVVLLEFCLHEMNEPLQALAQAKACAADVVVLNHGRESAWSWYAGDEDKVARSWRALDECLFRGQRDFVLPRRFANYAALADKFASSGGSASSPTRALRKLRCRIPCC